MTRILVQMRALSQSVSDLIGVYKSSPSPGARLAAIAMMQMQPNIADIDWLKERFSQEMPFVFYHAALALQNVVNSSPTGAGPNAIRAAADGLDSLSKFNGKPDSNTVAVLTTIIHSAES